MAILPNNSLKTFNRVVLTTIAASVGGEFVLLVVYGIILFPEGNLLHKVMWTLVYCGVGMGATAGAFTNLFVSGRYTGAKAVTLTALISFVLLGLLCDQLCYRLDLHFSYFGAPYLPPMAFHVTSWIGSLAGGAIVGYVLFGKRQVRSLATS